LAEIRLINCNIKDEGCQQLFDQLKMSPTVHTIDLSNNLMTERSFDSLVSLLQANKVIKHVELKGMNFKNKFALNRLKPFMDRIIM
jgi:hypothetical protein